MHLLVLICWTKKLAIMNILGFFLWYYLFSLSTKYIPQNMHDACSEPYSTVKLDINIVCVDRSCSLIYLCDNRIGRCMCIEAGASWGHMLHTNKDMLGDMHLSCVNWSNPSTYALLWWASFHSLWVLIVFFSTFFYSTSVQAIAHSLEWWSYLCFK